MRSDRNEGVEQVVLKNGKEEEKLGEIKGVIGYDWRRNESMYWTCNENLSEREH